MNTNRKLAILALSAAFIILSNSFLINSNAQEHFESLYRFGNIGTGQHIQEQNTTNKAPYIFGTNARKLDSSVAMLEIRTNINDDNGVKEAKVHWSTDMWQTSNTKKLSKTINNFSTQLLLGDDIKNFEYFIEAKDISGLISRDPEMGPQISYIAPKTEQEEKTLHAAAGPLPSETAKKTPIYFHDRSQIQPYHPLRDSRHAYYITRYEFLRLIFEPMGLIDEQGLLDMNNEAVNKLSLSELWPGKFEPSSYVGRFDALLMMLRARQLIEGQEHLSYQIWLNKLRDMEEPKLDKYFEDLESPKFYANLWRNQSGLYVAQIKDALNLLGYDAGSNVHYDNVLRAAITNFQLDQGLIQSTKEIRAGRFDNQTRERLNKVLELKGPFVRLKMERPDSLLRYQDALQMAEEILK